MRRASEDRESTRRSRAPLSTTWQGTLWVCGLLVGMGVWHAPGIFFVLALIWVVGKGVSRFSPAGDRRFVVGLFWGGVVARLLACTVAHIVATYFGMGYPSMYAIHGQQSYDLFGDSSVTSVQAYWMANYWSGTVHGDLLNMSRIFPGWQNPLLYLNAAFYYVFGFSPLALKWVYCLIGTLCGVVVYRIADMLCEQRWVIRTTALLATFFPSTFLWSLTNLKEAPNVLLLCLIVLTLLRLQVRSTWRDRGLLVLWLILLWCVRSQSVPIVVIGILLGGWLAWRINRWQKVAMSAAFILFLVGGAQMPGVGGAAAVFLRQAIAPIGDQLISVQRGRALRGGTNYVIYPQRVYKAEARDDVSLRALSLSEWSYALTKGVLYFLFAPFPWHISTLLQVATYPETLLWYVLIPLWMQGIVFGLRHRWRQTVAILSLVSILTVGLSLGSGNMGTAFRHRALVIPMFLLLSALGLCGYTRRVSPHAS